MKELNIKIKNDTTSGEMRMIKEEIKSLGYDLNHIKFEKDGFIMIFKK